MARPRKPIDLELLKKLAEKQWSIEEMAATLKVSRDTLHRRYAAEIDAAKHSGKAKLRDLQWKRALDGSDRMIIHMSKHYLGQHDKMDVHETFEPLVLNMPLSEQTVTVTKKGAHVSDKTPPTNQLPAVPVLPAQRTEERD